MSSGSPSQTVQDVGGPGAEHAEKPPRRLTGEPSLQVVQRGIECRLGGMIAGHFGQPRTDLFQRERVVTQECAVCLHERERGLRRLVVAGDRRRLATTRLPVVADLDLHDLGPVLHLAWDHERLGEAKPDNASADLHGANLSRQG